MPQFSRSVRVLQAVAYVYELQVEDRFQGIGLGTALMAVVEDLVRSLFMLCPSCA